MVHARAGTTLPYDDLIIALGAHPLPVLPGALAFRGRQDVPALREILTDLESRRISRVAFVLPTGNAWPLPLYELALMAATHVSSHGLDAQVLVVTCEEAPLEVFGPRASEAVSELLRARGIELHLSVLATRFEDGGLRLAAGAPVARGPRRRPAAPARSGDPGAAP